MTRDLSHIPKWDGWHLLGSYPEGDDDGVGSWLLYSEGEACLLELPPTLKVTTVMEQLTHLGCVLKYVTTSHDHDDHLDLKTWNVLQDAFPAAKFLYPGKAPRYGKDALADIGKEPLWLLSYPKHSLTDTIAVFKGVAMTGDVELGTVDTVNDEVLISSRRDSMQRWADFCKRRNYHVHSVVSAHLNDVRLGVDWPSLFQVG